MDSFHSIWSQRLIEGMQPMLAKMLCTDYPLRLINIFYANKPERKGIYSSTKVYIQPFLDGISSWYFEAALWLADALLVLNSLAESAI